MLKLSRRSGETLVIQTETEKVTIYFRIEGGRAKREFSFLQRRS